MNAKSIRGKALCWLLSAAMLAVAACCRATDIGPTRLTSLAAESESSVSGGGNSFAPIFSGDGRHLVFLSEANNLVTNDDHKPHLDIFVRDLVAGTTRLVSVNRSGLGGGNAGSSQFSVSSNGEVVAFASSASDLVPNSPSNLSEVYVRDTVAGTTVWARTNEAGGTVGLRISSLPLLSTDGRYLVFAASSDVVLRDLKSGAFTLLSVSTNGTGASAACEPASISADVGRVAFLTFATDIVPSAGGTNREVFVRDLVQQKTIWASSNVSSFFPTGATYACDQAVLTESGGQVVFDARNGAVVLLFRFDLDSGQLVKITDKFNTSAWPSISSDARYVAHSDGTNIYVWDAAAASNTLVNVRLSGTGPASGHSYSPTLSADATKVVFLSDSTELTSEDTHGQVQVFVRDRIAGATRLVSVNLSGSGVVTPDLHAILPVISPDGTVVAFDTADSGLVAGDNNHASDVFIRSLINETTELISEHALSLPSLNGVGASSVSRNCLSTDGRFLVFKSLSGDLVAGDTNGTPDLFLRDLDTGSNRVVSATTIELGGTNITITASEISSDGGYAAFSQRYWPSGAAVPQEEVWRRDLRSGNLTLVSAMTNAARSGGATAPTISADGRWIAFQTMAAGLVTNAYGVGSNVFLRDLFSEQTILVSVSASGSAANGNSWGPGITPDGRWVVFSSLNSSLISPPLSSSSIQVYARDVVSNRTYLVSTNPVFRSMLADCREVVLSGDARHLVFRTSGNPAQAYQHDLLTHSNLLVCNDCAAAHISRDGRWLAYQQPFSGTGPRQIGWKDLLTGVTNIVSVNNDGQPGNASSSNPLISPDGRYVIFLSLANNLVAAGANGLPNLLVRDLLQRKTLLLTPDLDGRGPGNGTVGPPILAADGQSVLFHSFASDLVEHDFNNDRDVFMLRLNRGDFDSDGMDDDWEVAYFGDLSRDGSGDFDNDGETDLAEFLAGSDPTNAGSVFRVMTVESPGSSVTRVLWSAVPGRVYQVQYKTNLNDATWANLAGPLMTTDSTGVVSDSQAAQSARRFYRVLLVQ